MRPVISIEDEGWNEVPDLEGLVTRAMAEVSAVQKEKREAEVAILFTSDDEVAALNRDWRGKPKPTNVLSFPAPEGLLMPEGEPRFLGDIALALGVVKREAEEQGKPLPHHTAHLVVHGLLHLLGLDHETEPAAEAMEALEIRIMGRLGIPDPYAAVKLL
jgi:probable rRNA maturation factor